MSELTERDERFIRAWSYWYPAIVSCLLNVAERTLPRRLYFALATFACDTAWPMGVAAGWMYCNVRDFSDFLRWLIYGPPKRGA